MNQRRLRGYEDEAIVYGWREALHRIGSRVERPPNKGMKLTKPEHNGALQLIPGVGQTTGE